MSSGYEPGPLDQTQGRADTARMARLRVSRAWAPSSSISGTALTVLGYVVVAALVVLLISWFV